MDWNGAGLVLCLIAVFILFGVWFYYFIDWVTEPRSDEEKTKKPRHEAGAE